MVSFLGGNGTHHSRKKALPFTMLPDKCSKICNKESVFNATLNLILDNVTDGISSRFLLEGKVTRYVPGTAGPADSRWYINDEFFSVRRT